MAHNLNKTSSAENIAAFDCHDKMSVIFDHMDILICITDPETHEILFVNDVGCQRYGAVEGRKCWEILNDTMGESCAMCRNISLVDANGSPTGPQEWMFQDAKGRWNGVSVQAVEWDGRLVHMHVIKDITSYVEVEVELRKREKLLEKIIDILPVGLCYVDSESRPVLGNSAGKEIWGLPLTETPSKPSFDYADYSIYEMHRYPSGEKVTPENISVEKSLRQGLPVENELLEIETFDGKRKIISNHTAPVFSDDGEIMGAVVINQDMTDLIRSGQALMNEQERLRTTLKSIGEGVVVTDHTGAIIITNGAMQRISGYTEEYMVGKRFSEVFALVDEDTGRFLHGFPQQDQDVVSGNALLVCNGGLQKPVLYSASTIRSGGAGDPQGAILVIRDASMERKKQEEILYLGYHDSLTGLYNRTYLDDAIERLDVPASLPLCVMVGDVDGLKLANDAFGHSSGDEILKAAAEVIRQSCRDTDIVARWGGDEFLILLPHTDEAAAEKIYNRITGRLASIQINNLVPSVSLGYEVKTSPAMQISQVLKKAEDYMYRKKLVRSPSMRGKTVSTMLQTFQERNPREELHSCRVSQLSRKIGEVMSLSEKELNELELAGLMHDIGKIALNDSILDKDSPLTHEEWLEIQRHPEIGYRILCASREMVEIAGFILAHHERWDGQGYPNKIGGISIPLQARILAVADAYDAMTSLRPYRSPMAPDQAFQEIWRNAGSQFDPDIVQAFSMLFQNGVISDFVPVLE